MRSTTFFLDGAFRRGPAFSKLVLIVAARSLPFPSPFRLSYCFLIQVGQSLPKIQDLSGLGFRFASFSIRRTKEEGIFFVSNAKIIVGGGLVAYADARTDPATEPSQAATKKKVVVLGTGWAGTTFVRNVDSSLYDVQVISPRNYFAFTPLLPSVTCGTVEPRSIVEPIRKIIRKEVEDAQKIRKGVIDSFERAILPDLDEEERKRTLHFVIVGGGPTGVEFAAELHDFISEDLAKLYPTVCNLVKISVIEHGGHILTM
ncbi:hypothetical protein BHE74_00018616 [Ensete ventricosum]|uniref:NADH:ubiquinone reductase (non-electrogenic) n=1 Tax=Ensete ventricosum TaxID=4639 RepID=A0A426YJ53_ENSVE|nr:hypothetical protein B296_00018493 [Ensete ventricosum]RWW73510.1 hypothetical protein BHE74_00018616 [Ensete ventricosum]